MGRVPRITTEKALYYVTSRGDNNENIFRDAADHNVYLDLLKKSKDQFGFKLFAYVLMPNHLHLLIGLKENVTISQIMHSLHSSYTKSFNKRHQKKGHLFQERYKLMLLEKEPYLLDMSAYIHLNPKISGLTADLENYPYSSYLSYLGGIGIQPDLTGEVKEVLGALKGRGYADYVMDFYQNKSKPMSEKLNRKTILGSDEFIGKIRQEIEICKLHEEKAGQGMSASGAANNKKFILIGAIIILILGSASVYLYNSRSLAKARSTRDMDDYYRVMSRNLETEKQKARSLEERLGQEAGLK